MTTSQRKSKATAEMIATALDGIAHARLGLTSNLAALMNTLWMQPQAVHSPEDTMRLCWRLFPRLSGFKQQDVDEFIRAVVSRLEGEWASGSLAAGPSLLATFQHEQLTRVECQRCASVSERVCVSTGPVSVQVPVALHSQPKTVSRSRRGPVCTLQSCLAELFGTESITGYACETCKSPQGARITNGFRKLPDVIVLHIVRTSWVFGGKKIETFVEFPVRHVDRGHTCMWALCVSMIVCDATDPSGHGCACGWGWAPSLSGLSAVFRRGTPWQGVG